MGPPPKNPLPSSVSPPDVSFLHSWVLCDDGPVKRSRAAEMCHSSCCYCWSEYQQIVWQSETLAFMLSKLNTAKKKKEAERKEISEPVASTYKTFSHAQSGWCHDWATAKFQVNCSLEMDEEKRLSPLVIASQRGIFKQCGCWGGGWWTLWCMLTPCYKLPCEVPSVCHTLCILKLTRTSVGYMFLSAVTSSWQYSAMPAWLFSKWDPPRLRLR